MNKICRICKLEFRPEVDKTAVVVCKDCTGAIKEVLFTDSERKDILDILVKDNDIKNVFVDKMLDDQDVLKKVCLKLFSMPVKDIGLGGSGSIADFFREEVDAQIS